MFKKETSKPSKGTCKYCQQNVIWVDRKPYDSFEKLRVRHDCPKYPRVRVVEQELVRHEYKDVTDVLKAEIEALRREMQLIKPAPAIVNQDHENRIKRLEAIIVELRTFSQRKECA